MKLSTKQFQMFIKNIPDNIHCFSIYGEDSGSIAAYYNQLIEKFQDKTDSFQNVFLNADFIKQDPSYVLLELQNKTFFGNCKLLTIKYPQESQTVFFKDILEKRHRLSGKIFILSKEMSTQSSLRKLFENHKNAMSLPCYALTSKEKQNFIENFFLKQKLNVSREAIHFLYENFQCDSALMKQELEKIFCYFISKKNSHKEIDLKLINSVFIGNYQGILQNFVYSVFQGDQKQSLYFFDHLKNQGLEAFVVFQALRNYFMRLYNFQISFEQGNSFENVMAEASPKIFFKERPFIANHLRIWKLSSLELLKKDFLDLSIQMKHHYALAFILLGYNVVKICKKAHDFKN